MAGTHDPVLSWNERIKLDAGFINAIGLGLIGFAVLKPLTEDLTKITELTVLWGRAGLVLHAIAIHMLGLMGKA